MGTLDVSHSPAPQPTPCVCLQGGNAGLRRWLVRTPRKPAWLCRIVRKHTNVSISHCPRKSNQEAVSTQSGFAGLREA